MQIQCASGSSLKLKGSAPKICDLSRDPNGEAVILTEVDSEAQSSIAPVQEVLSPSLLLAATGLAALSMWLWPTYYQEMP